MKDITEQNSDDQFDQEDDEADNQSSDSLEKLARTPFVDNLAHFVVNREEDPTQNQNMVPTRRARPPEIGGRRRRPSCRDAAVPRPLSKLDAYLHFHSDKKTKMKKKKRKPVSHYSKGLSYMDRKKE